MALLHSDGFDSHATGAAVLADGNPTFGAQVGVQIDGSAGRFGGKSLTLAASTTGFLLTTITSGGGQLYLAGWFKVAAITAPLILIRDGAGALVTLNVDRTLTVKDGAGTTRFTTAAAALPVNTWVWIEVSYASGIIAYYNNGVPLDSYSGAYTAPANATPIQLLAAAAADNAGRIDVDDFIIWDNTGSYMNARGLAPRRIQLLRPNAAGASSGWVPASGSNWAAVDAATWAGGVGVGATNIGQKDRYNFTDLAATPGTVDAVTVRAKAISTGSDPATLALVNAQGVTEVTSTPQTVPTSAAVLQATFYRDANNVAWTEATVNSAEFGQVLGA